MLKKIFTYFTLPLLLLFGTSWENSEAQFPEGKTGRATGTLEKMIVAERKRHDGSRFEPAEGKQFRGGKIRDIAFRSGPNSFFTILVFNNVLRGPEPGSMGLIAENSAILPEPLKCVLQPTRHRKSCHRAEPFDLVVRDGKTGFVFFNIEGNLYEYDAAAHLLSIKDGRLLISEEFAAAAWASGGRWVGGRRNFDRGDHVSDRNHHGRQRRSPIVGPASSACIRTFQSCAGPDVIVGDLSVDWQQFGSSGTQVGLAVGTTPAIPET